MNTYTFICDEGPGLITGYSPQTKTTMTFKTVELEEILEHFELFLKGAGFVFDGKLCIFEDEEYNT